MDFSVCLHRLLIPSPQPDPARDLYRADPTCTGTRITGQRQQSLGKGDAQGVSLSKDKLATMLKYNAQKMSGKDGLAQSSKLEE